MEKDVNNKRPGWLTANRDFYRNYKHDRQKLKDNMTKAESLLWEHLKNKNLGVKFRRQHIIDFYIPDFVALPIKLIIEVDGGIHIKQSVKDKERERRLELLEFKVIRFTNQEVENDIENVVRRIKKVIKTMYKSSR